MPKGGLALQLRLGQRARTTEDIDVLLCLARPEIGSTLTRAGELNLNDWFSFTVQQDPAQLPGPADGGWRFFVTARVASRTFETFHVDIGVGDPVLEPAEALATPPLLALAGDSASVLSGDLAFTRVAVWDGATWVDRTTDWQSGAASFTRFCSGYLAGPHSGFGQ